MEKSLEEIRRDVQNWYCNKLDAMQIENEYDLILYCSYAGRLYSLGIEQYLPKADALLYNSSFKNEINQIFLDRIDQGIWDLQEQTGKEIGISLTELQDMHSFLKRSSYPFSSQVRHNFEEWIEAAHYADVNAETIDYINDFFDANPLDSADVLDALLHPTPREVRELDFILSGCRFTDCELNQTDSGWEITDGEYKFFFEFQPSCNEKLCFEAYELQMDEKVPIEGVTIRQNILSAVQNPDSPLLWSIDYTQFCGSDLSQQRLAPLSICLPTGGVCTMPAPGSTNQINDEAITHDAPFLTKLSKRIFIGTSENEMPSDASSLLDISKLTSDKNGSQYLTKLSDNTFIYFCGHGMRNNVNAPLDMSASDSDKPYSFKMSISDLDCFLNVCVDKAANQVFVQAYSNQDGCMTDALDGWSLFGENGVLLGTFNGKAVKYQYSEEFIPMILEDKNETSYLLTPQMETDY